ncbi:PREDICTED: transmembrane 4 L6 family member 19 [Corvus brachyrhynchos]|uniref:transmembrane 4 L6 family member 19 n=1 Tax=Corvus brachyrhynchos TaxID=85066 RepID=UPI0004DE04D9|nr:PREDICTED: transmembrane 4 L6 family member 19 [Corvus brachyrhynchos]
MCVGKCSRIVGPCLLVLGTLSMAASSLLLFPAGASKYLLEGHISSHPKAVPGVWGGGIAVLLAGTHITALGWQCSGCGTRTNAFISVVLSKLALLGATACFVLSGVGLTNGPLCFYNTTELGLRHGALWGYPFLDAIDQGPDARAENYLYSRRTWNICMEPEGIVSWHVVLFSLLLLISVAEMVALSHQPGAEPCERWTEPRGDGHPRC